MMCQLLWFKKPDYQKLVFLIFDRQGFKKTKSS